MRTPESEAQNKHDWSDCLETRTGRHPMLLNVSPLLQIESVADFELRNPSLLPSL